MRKWFERLERALGEQSAENASALGKCKHCGQMFVGALVAHERGYCSMTCASDAMQSDGLSIKSATADQAERPAA